MVSKSFRKKWFESFLLKENAFSFLFLSFLLWPTQPSSQSPAPRPPPACGRPFPSTRALLAQPASGIASPTCSPSRACPRPSWANFQTSREPHQRPRPARSRCQLGPAYSMASRVSREPVVLNLRIEWTPPSSLDPHERAPRGWPPPIKGHAWPPRRPFEP